MFTDTLQCFTYSVRLMRIFVSLPIHSILIYTDVPRPIFFVAEKRKPRKSLKSCLHFGERKKKKSKKDHFLLYLCETYAVMIFRQRHYDT